MNWFSKSLIFFLSSKIIHNTMDSSLKIKNIDKLINHTFDKSKTYTLYINIPFYNEFESTNTLYKIKYEKNLLKEYLFCLTTELRKLKSFGIKFSSVIIKGNPLINHYELASIIELIKKDFEINDVICKTNINYMQKDILKDFDGLISKLYVNTYPYKSKSLKNVINCNKYNFNMTIHEEINRIKGIIPFIGIEFIFNLYNQTKDSLVENLQVLKDLDIDEILTYPLITHKLEKTNTIKNLYLLKQSSDYEFYEIVREELSSYYANNAWSFTKNKQGDNNFIINNNDYIGLGSGAFTYINNQLFINAFDIQQYKYMINNHSNAHIAMSNVLHYKVKVQYIFLLNLFKGEVNISNFNKLINGSIESILKKEIFMLKMIEAIKVENGIIYPTKYGNFVMVVIMKKIYEYMDNLVTRFKNTKFDY